MKRITEYTPVIRGALKAYLQDESRRQSSAWRQDLLGRLEPFAAGGKLLRGSLVCFSYEAFSGRAADDAVIKAAVAIELAHSGLLIHDDIIDGDELRRGQPSLHRQYEDLGRTLGQTNAARFGSGMALVGGDAALLLAFKLLADAGSDDVGRQKLQRCFTDQLVETCIGQMQDIAGQTGDKPSKRAIYDIMRAKTGGYTIALPLIMGAILAGQPTGAQKSLRTFGLAAGTIFQIRDDELGALGDSRQTGKPVGADIREGKQTLIYYYLAKHGDAGERAKLKQIFGNPQASETAIGDIQRLIRKHKIGELLGQDVAHLRRQAESTLQQIELPPAARAEFKALLRFCSQRLA